MLMRTSIRKVAVKRSLLHFSEHLAYAKERKNLCGDNFRFHLVVFRFHSRFFYHIRGLVLLYDIYHVGTESACHLLIGLDMDPTLQVAVTNLLVHIALYWVAVVFSNAQLAKKFD